MTAPPPRRPWYRRKRTWAAVAVWVVVYPLSYGPAVYGTRRGWLPPGVYVVAYWPVIAAVRHGPQDSRLLFDYGRWWEELAIRHAAD